MATPHLKIEQMCQHSGPHFARFAPAVAGRKPVQLDTHRRRRGGDLRRSSASDNRRHVNETAVLTLPDDLDSMRWDDVVDVVCVGSGFAMLASAIVSSDAGLETFVADGSGAHVGTYRADSQADLPSRLGVDDAEFETRDYLTAVTEDLETPAGLRDPRALRVATVDPRAAGPGYRVPPFVGSALRSWAGSCLASPSGALYTDIVAKNMSPARTEEDGQIEAAVVAPIDATASRMTLGEFLATQAHLRGIHVHSESPLRRLVFDHTGRVDGIVVATPDGARAVRARHGVVIASGPGVDPDIPLAVQQPARLCLMSRTASRFTQLGVLVDLV